jgi:hypothetical protein
VTRSFVNRLLRLTLLAPDIQDAILEARQPNGMQLEGLTGLMPYAWSSSTKDLLALDRSRDPMLRRIACNTPHEA